MSLLAFDWSRTSHHEIGDYYIIFVFISSVFSNLTFISLICEGHMESFIQMPLHEFERFFSFKSPWKRKFWNCKSQNLENRKKCRLSYTIFCFK